MNTCFYCKGEIPADQQAVANGEIAHYKCALKKEAIFPAIPFVSLGVSIVLVYWFYHGGVVRLNSNMLVFLGMMLLFSAIVFFIGKLSIIRRRG